MVTASWATIHPEEASPLAQKMSVLGIDIAKLWWVLSPLSPQIAKPSQRRARHAERFSRCLADGGEQVEDRLTCSLILCGILAYSFCVSSFRTPDMPESQQTAGQAGNSSALARKGMRCFTASLKVYADSARLRSGACSQEAVCYISTTSLRGMRKRKSPRSSLRVSLLIWNLHSDDWRPIKRAVPRSNSVTVRRHISRLRSCFAACAVKVRSQSLCTVGGSYTTMIGRSGWKEDPL